MINDWLKRPWLRRTFFVAVNLAVAYSFLTLMVFPLWSFYSDRDVEIATRRELVSRLTAVAARDSDVRAIAQQSTKEVRSEEFLAGPNESVASANLQARLKAIGEAAGARIRSVQGMPPKSSGQIRYIGARIDFYGPLQAMHRTIHAIEAARPYLFITTALIKPSPQVGNQGVATEPVFETQVDVFGAVQIGGRD